MISLNQQRAVVASKIPGKTTHDTTIKQVAIVLGSHWLLGRHLILSI